jgi:ribosomal protein S27E
MITSKYLEVFIPIKPTSRTGKWGRDIKCPRCNHIESIHHFAWSALQCTSCKQMVDKYDYTMRLLTGHWLT